MCEGQRPLREGRLEEHARADGAGDLDESGARTSSGPAAAAAAAAAERQRPGRPTDSLPPALPRQAGRPLRSETEAGSERENAPTAESLINIVLQLQRQQQDFMKTVTEQMQRFARSRSSSPSLSRRTEPLQAPIVPEGAVGLGNAQVFQPSTDSHFNLQMNGDHGTEYHEIGTPKTAEAGARTLSTAKKPSICQWFGREFFENAVSSSELSERRRLRPEHGER